MRVFNVMMTKSAGGIHQASIDYAEALEQEGHEVINITSRNADVNQKLSSLKLPNITQWCILSRIIFRIFVFIHKPDIIIGHGNRAIVFSRFMKPKNIPLIGISHNYSHKQLLKCDYVIVLTDHLKQYMIDAGYDESRMFKIPNMVRIKHDYLPRKYRKPITIGTYNRFVTNKGLKYLIEAIAILKKQGLNIKFILGGSGEEENNFRKLVAKLDLQQDVTFSGWMNDQDAFFDKIDIFCFPSILEPFGIILIEAMEHSMPIVAAKSSGPSEILRDNQDGLMADMHSSQDLADKLTILINNPDQAKKLGKSAYHRLRENYDINIVAKQISDSLEKIVR